MQSTPISTRVRPAFLRATLLLACVGLFACGGSGSSGDDPGTQTPGGSGDSDGSGNSDGSNGDAVSQPALRQTLPASWDENWFASPAVYDLDGDGSAEIVAARDSVLYVWSSDGSALWHTPAGKSASTASGEHGSDRQYASPVVGDFDGDGDGACCTGPA